MTEPHTTFDVIILGGGASGMLCALAASERGRRVLVIEHRDGAGSKVRISGGGRCNFTNATVTANNYFSGNPHFCKSALSRYTPSHIRAFVSQAGLTIEERAHGRYFLAQSAQGLVEALVQRGCAAGATWLLGTRVANVAPIPSTTATRPDAGVDTQAEGGAAASRYQVSTNRGTFTSHSLVVATGGLSYPSIGASSLGFEIAAQAGLAVTPRSPGLVPLTVPNPLRDRLAPLSGIAVPATVQCGRFACTENLLFTHRGLSGPLILQVSNAWNPGETIMVNLAPAVDLRTYLKEQRAAHPRQSLRTALGSHLPRRVLEVFLPATLLERSLADSGDSAFAEAARALNAWHVVPDGTEGYTKAEVTRGGVDTAGISSQTMEARNVPGLYFIGEVLDVTGWLGGYNLHWAWASGWCAGQYV